MRFAGTERDDDGPWFRLRDLEVTTPILILLAWAATLLIWIAEGPGRSVTSQLVLTTDEVQRGQLWRLLTWPLAHGTFSLWDIINAGIFWLFATELERETGRRPFAALLGVAVLVVGVAATALALVIDRPTALWDLDLLALTVVLLYCAEHPTRPFFFNIPAWAIGAVIAALELVNDLGNRDFTRLLTVLIASGAIALVAKRIGLLGMYDRIPEWPVRERRRDREPAGGRPARATGRRRQRGSDAEIVPMPDAAPLRRVPEPATPPNADDVMLDALLDKISAGGMDALSDDERQQLEAIRARRGRE